MWKKEYVAPLETIAYLSSPTMHREELEYIKLAFDTNWMSCLGENIDETERLTRERVNCGYSVAVGSGTAALHLAVKLAAEEAYGTTAKGRLSLEGKRVFVSDTTFVATVSPVIYEGGKPVFIDMERETWNMDPAALERAFEKYPDTRIVILAYLYGTPAKLDELRDVCDRHQAILVEDAAEALGSIYKGKALGSFGKYNVISFNGNKIITGSAGGILLSDEKEKCEKARKWSTQSREAAPWYQHEEISYNYRMSNVIAGVIRGQFLHIEEHIAQKTAIYDRYAKGLRNLPVTLNPIDLVNTVPNHWLTCMVIRPEAMCGETRLDRTYSYEPEPGKSCPMEILEALQSIHAQGRPIWKPMHMQPYYADCDFITAENVSAGQSVGTDIYRRGLCLPSDNKMTPEVQDRIIEMICRCFA